MITANPLAQMDLHQALEAQHRLVDAICRHFEGDEILQAGDYGLHGAYGRPRFTARVEATLADFFGAPAAALVRGAGTGAIRGYMMAALRPGARVLIHDAPVYPSTNVTCRAMGLALERVDFNLPFAPSGPAPDLVLLQHARQRIDDTYNLSDAIAEVRHAFPRTPILVDDNYATLKAPAIGVQMGATASAFSAFKLLGPEGVGVLVGDEATIAAVRQDNYSGGGQVQGPEAMLTLKAMVMAPLAFAAQALVVEEVARRLNAGEVSGVLSATVANAQSRVVLAELERPVAGRVIAAAAGLGAAAHPVGAESRHEVTPLVYRASGTFIQANPDLAGRVVRINPMRAGAGTVLRILTEAIARAGVGGG
ncbi:MAG TPA: aminotransferase class I/II-fold pyridoxal phosphate-dependent enzyme [Symbiobacteriaceae bacterium]|jgi:selenocysteine lyase/cysteine desulfurase